MSDFWGSTLQGAIVPMSEEPVVRCMDLPMGCQSWNSPLAMPSPHYGAVMLPRHPKPWVFHRSCYGLSQQLAQRQGKYYRPICFRGLPLYYPNYLALMPGEVLRKIEGLVEPAELIEL